MRKGDSPMLPNNPNHDTDTRPMAFRSASPGKPARNNIPVSSVWEEELVILFFASYLLEKGQDFLFVITTDGESYTYPMTAKLHTAFFSVYNPFSAATLSGRDYARKAEWNGGGR